MILSKDTLDALTKRFEDEFGKELNVKQKRSLVKQTLSHMNIAHHDHNNKPTEVYSYLLQKLGLSRTSKHLLF